MTKLGSWVIGICWLLSFPTAVAQPSIEGAEAGPTTLEQALTHAYNLKVADGTWARLFGRPPLSGFRADNFCSGDNAGWPIPPVTAGSDLERVLDRGTFVCGYLEGLRFSGGEHTMVHAARLNENGTALGNQGPLIYGLAVDWWEGVVQRLGDMYRFDLGLEWKLYRTSQLALEALQNGEIDGACPYWQADGVFLQDRSSPPIARGLAFSKMACPVTLETESVWVYKGDGSDLKYESFDDLMKGVQTGEITRLCAAAQPGSGSESNCRNVLRQYSASLSSSTLTIECDGMGPVDSFSSVILGECSAVWSGTPPDQYKDDFVAFRQPTSTARVSFMRLADLNSKTFESPQEVATGTNPSSKSVRPPSGITTLEQATTAAFNLKVADGTYARHLTVFTTPRPDQEVSRTFLPNVEAPSLCAGNAAAWGTPEPLPGSDLEAALERGTFRCGFVQNRKITAGNYTLMDSTAPSTAGDAVVRGAVADYWSNEVIPALGSMYDTEIRIEWILRSLEAQTFDDLNNGRIDAACGTYDPDGIWVNRERNRLEARPLAFSPMYCPSLLQTANIFTTTTSGVDSFEKLVKALRERITAVGVVCVADVVPSGSVLTCENTFRQYTNSAGVKCQGLTPVGEFSVGLGDLTAAASDEAFRRLQHGECDAVWGGVLPQGTQILTPATSSSKTGIDGAKLRESNSAVYHVFPQPQVFVPTTFFRYVDASMLPQRTVSPTSPPTANTDFTDQNGANAGSGCSSVHTTHWVMLGVWCAFPMLLLMFI